MQTGPEKNPPKVPFKKYFSSLEKEPFREHYKIEKQNKELHPSKFLKQLLQTVFCTVECKVRENINKETSREAAKKKS